MQSLKFKQLLLISNSTKSANQFDFQKDLTIITADDNNYGKSTLGKLLYWSLGCDPDFDTKWTNLECKTILKFSVGKNNYETMRAKSFICLNENGTITFYPKITGDFSDRIAKILGFHALLPKRDSVDLETPPPAYFFVPFYIDQKRSWAAAWDNFDKLEQYTGWKSTIIKYHIGLLPKEHFELELSKSLKKREKQLVEVEIQKMNSALEVVSQFITEPAATIDKATLQKLTDEIRIDLKKLSDFQEKTLDEFAKLEGDRSFLHHQKVISERIIKDLEKDYQYTVEHFDEEEIECPLCGTHHDNSVINRASILTDKQQAESQLQQISNNLSETEDKLEKIKGKLEKTRNDVDAIHAKYIIEGNGKDVQLNEIIENIAGNSIRSNVQDLQAIKLLSSKNIGSDIRDISSSQNGLLTEEHKKEINDNFIKTFTTYLELLGADDINTSEISSPLNYNKIEKEGGAAEGSRGILAYYMAIHTLIENSGNDVLAPILIDTPNQQEQSISNYDKILELIKKKVSAKSQIILCALQNEKLDTLIEGANIINLDANKLLIETNFEEIKKQFDNYKLEGLEENSGGNSD